MAFLGEAGVVGLAAISIPLLIIFGIEMFLVGFSGGRAGELSVWLGQIVVGEEIRSLFVYGSKVVYRRPLNRANLNGEAETGPNMGGCVAIKGKCCP